MCPAEIRPRGSHGSRFIEFCRTGPGGDDVPRSRHARTTRVKGGEHRRDNFVSRAKKMVEKSASGGVEAVFALVGSLRALSHAECNVCQRTSRVHGQRCLCLGVAAGLGTLDARLGRFTLSCKPGQTGRNTPSTSQMYSSMERRHSDRAQHRNSQRGRRRP